MKNPDYWQDSLNYLTKTDKALGNIISQFKDYSISSRGEAYETLLRSIVGQQISIQAASSVWNKIVELVKTIEPNKVLLTSRENLKLCGLSKQKTQYIYKFLNILKLTILLIIILGRSELILVSMKNSSLLKELVHGLQKCLACFTY